jgi:hypothetical protein
MVSRTNDVKNPRILLETDHRELDGRLDRLILLLREDDPGAAIKAWRSFEEALLAHFDVEEMYVLPKLEEDDGPEARALRSEHDSIRRTLGELGLAFELHTIRAEMFNTFCERLRAHAEREESLLYKHAERHLPVSIARSIYQRLRGAIAPPPKRRSSRVQPVGPDSARGERPSSR